MAKSQMNRQSNYEEMKLKCTYIRKVAKVICLTLGK